MTQLTTTTYRTLRDLHMELEDLVEEGAGRALETQERLDLAVLAGTIVRAFELPQEELEKLLPAFRAKATSIGERLGAGATVEDAIVSDTKYCVQAE